MTGIQNAAFWQKKGTQSERIYNMLKTMRGTNLMQQLWFIVINISTCFGHLYAHLQEYRLCAVSDTNSHTVHKTTHRLLRTTATTPSAEHHMQAAHNLYSWRWAYRCPKHVEIFKVINHNCCIKLVPLVIFHIWCMVTHTSNSTIHCCICAFGRGGGGEPRALLVSYSRYCWHLW